ncbi:MAG: hypothetical protein PHT39_06340 [Sphaerochaetaceae bacterium]|jgi:hypothetical protein|nr:hypothetical protein [Candidatus Methanomethylophilaceae archaeon]MDD4397177.1 hypothetical protein [Sphaerochaetaceae bacterium]
MVIACQQQKCKKAKNLIKKAEKAILFLDNSLNGLKLTLFCINSGEESGFGQKSREKQEKAENKQ